MPAVGSHTPHAQSLVLEDAAPFPEREQPLVDVLLRGALLTHHLPAGEIAIGHHDAELRARFRHPQHFLETAAHIEEVLE